MGGRENRRFQLTDEAIGIPTANNNSKNDNNDSDQQQYFCQDCTADVSVGDPKCDNCGEELDWRGISR